MPHFPLKKTDPKVIEHVVEQRGFVQVPLDYSKPDAEKIEIFYRLIPSYGLKPNDPSKPIIVVINGGPGIPSSFYRALDFDYQTPGEKFDRFKFLLNSYRILIADQRGTDGQSAPLDMKDPSINANDVAKYFSSDSQALDYAKVIETVIPAGESFYMIAQSYGGMVGMQYLSQMSFRKPKGIVFSCSALPYEDVKDAMMSRRKEQLKLNRHLKRAVPDIEDRLMKVRNHLASVNLNPDMINGLFTYLGKEKEGVWENTLVAHLEKMLTQTGEELKKGFEQDSNAGDLLNFILSSANFTPGYTDRTLARMGSELFPFEPWMLDENWVLMQIGMNQEWSKKLVLEMDKNPPRPTSFAKVEKLRTCIALNQLLFLSADNDAFVPAEAYVRALEKFTVPGHTQHLHVPGGHHAVFLEDGYHAFNKWSKAL